MIKQPKKRIKKTNTVILNRRVLEEFSEQNSLTEGARSVSMTNFYSAFISLKKKKKKDWPIVTYKTKALISLATFFILPKNSSTAKNCVNTENKF